MAAVPSIGRASLVEAPRVAPQAAATQGLYERHAAKIQSYCHHQLGSREEAEDAVQTTFMNAFRALGRGVVPEAESAWLFKIAENVCLSRRRSSWRRGKIESPSDFGVIEEIVPGPNRQRDELIGIEDALASMPEQQRRAILLREWQGLSYREVAEELDVSQSAVETLIFRARRSLAQGLEQPDSVKPAKRKSFRRALHALDLGTVIAALKTLLAGSAAVKATAAAVAVTAAAGTAVTVAPQPETKPPVSAPAKALVAPAPPAASPSKSFSIASTPARTTGSASKPAAAATSRPAGQKPVRAAVTRSVPVSAAPAASAPVHDTPLAAEPVTPVAEPVHTAPAAPAEQPVAEHAPAPTHEAPKPEHVTPLPTPEPATRTDEGNKNEGTDVGKQEKGKGASTEPMPAIGAPEPSAVVSRSPVVDPADPVEQPGEGNRDNRRKGNDDRRDKRDEERRHLAVAPILAPTPTPAVEVLPAVPAELPVAAAPAPTVATAPALVAEQGSGSRTDDRDKGTRGDRRRGK